MSNEAVDLASLPSDWQRPTSDQLQAAVQRTSAAVEDPRAPGWLREYYDPAGNYAGGSFLSVGPNNPDSVDADDLFAISLLNVQVWPRAARQLLESEDNRQQLSEVLRHIPVDADLAVAGENVWAAASAFYRMVKPMLGANAWVTASKLCARKRPRFFPVRDRVATVRGLGLGKESLTDWAAYKHLMQHAGVQQVLHDIVDEVTRGGSTRVTIADPPLRVLDALLWMFMRHGEPTGGATT